MCGICGILSTEPFDRQVIEAMNNIARHRGPDDEGYIANDGKDWHPFGGEDTQQGVFSSHRPGFPNTSIRRAKAPVYLAVGHRRLSVIDTSISGHQPMYYGGRYWISFNGEIYNYIELKNELLQKGYQFQTNTDTEVIGASFDAWGTHAFDRFNGMWGIAIVDTLTKRITLSRDRFGVKPVYYYQPFPGLFCFASEIKQFTALDCWIPVVNRTKLYEFFTASLTDHSRETLFDRVQQLSPGSFITVSYDTPRMFKIVYKQWYQIPEKRYEGSYESAQEQFTNFFVDSVRLRMRTDVPFGSCLSGGLDSSAIVGVASALQENPLHTFTAKSLETKLDETTWARLVTNHSACHAETVTPNSTYLLSMLEKLAWHQDEPFQSSSIFAQWEVFRSAHKTDIKVLLDGQGADEMLFGYHIFFSAYLSKLLRGLRLIELTREMRQLRVLHHYSLPLIVGLFSNFLLPEPIRQPLLRIFDYANDRPDWLNYQKLVDRPYDALAGNGAKTTSPKQYSYSQITKTNLPKLLRWEDRNSMAHSVESRLPFLDYRLVEFSLSLPDEYKIRHGVTKKILRDSLAKYLPPRIVARMDKIGFATEEANWLKADAKIYRDYIIAAVEASNGVLNSNAVVHFDEFCSGKRKYDFRYWKWISFGNWVQAFSVRM